MEVSENLHEQAKAQVRSIVERVERLEESKAEIAEDIKQVYLEAKGNGFDVKAIRKIVAMRKKDQHVLLEEQAILSTYLHALGMLADTPLGAASLKSSGFAPRTAQEPAEADDLKEEVIAAAEIEAARVAGHNAAIRGEKISDSRWLSSDPRGKAWEEGYIGANAHASVAA